MYYRYRCPHCGVEYFTKPASFTVECRACGNSFAICEIEDVRSFSLADARLENFYAGML